MKYQLWTCSIIAASFALACSASPGANGNDFPGSAGSAGTPAAGGSAGTPGVGGSAGTPGVGGSAGSAGSGQAGAGGSGNPPPPPVANKAAMPRISVGRPAYAKYSSGSAADAFDADYGSSYRSSHVPSTGDPDWLAVDLSGVPLAQRKTVYSVWFNEYGYNYITSDGYSYTLPGDFQIQANAAAGGSKPPSSGWVTLTSTKGNELSSGANLLDLSGYNWVRFFCTAHAPNSDSQNQDLSLQWNLYDAHLGNDGWKFGGDSITANSMGHKGSNDSFSQLVNAKVKNYPAFEMAGHGGWTAGTMLGYIDSFVADFPGLYFGLSLGTNDAPGNDPPTFNAEMSTLIDKVIAAKKIPVVPTIPYAGDPQHVNVIPKYNAEIQALYNKYGSKLVHGPDLYTIIYQGRASYFDNPTDLHPNEAGNHAIRQAWADAMVKNVYSK
jgi:lysophospholipase L1-like esterase